MPADNKAPSYPWYPRDFEADEPVKVMSLAEECCYRRLLDHQWLHGSIPSDLPQLAAICKQIPPGEMRKYWPRVEPCFRPMRHRPDRLQNRRLERIRKERKAYRDRQVASGRKGGKASGRNRALKQKRTEPSIPLEAKRSLASAFASASAVPHPTPNRVSNETRQAELSTNSTDLPTSAGMDAIAGAVREHWWSPDGNPPPDWSMARELSTWSEYGGRERLAESLSAIQGLRILADSGEVDWLKPGAKLTARALLCSRNGALPVYQRALSAYFTHGDQFFHDQPRNSSGDLTTISDVLTNLTGGPH